MSRIFFPSDVDVLNFSHRRIEKGLPPRLEGQQARAEKKFPSTIGKEEDVRAVRSTTLSPLPPT